MPESKKRKGRKPPPAQRASPKKEIAKNPSPTWYAIVMFALMGLGVALVLLNYIVPDVFGRWGLFVGLGSIAVGFLMLTNFR